MYFRCKVRLFKMLVYVTFGRTAKIPGLRQTWKQRGVGCNQCGFFGSNFIFRIQQVMEIILQFLWCVQTHKEIQELMNDEILESRVEEVMQGHFDT